MQPTQAVPSQQQMKKMVKIYVVWVKECAFEQKQRWPTFFFSVLAYFPSFDFQSYYSHTHVSHAQTRISRTHARLTHTRASHAHMRVSRTLARTRALHMHYNSDTI